MTFARNRYIKGSMVLAITLGMRALSFAGNTIGDVPTSANENRTIQRETTLYTSTCDITQDLGFYEGSPIYLRVAQPKGPVSYVFDKVETYVRVYNQPLFAGNLKFPYISNFVPSTTVDTSSSSILTVDATGAIFSGGAITTPRNQVAGQIVTKNNERSVIQNNTNGATLNYYYKRSSDLSLHNGTMKVTINPSLTTKTSCTNYYVARCGDGIIDKPTGSSDGNGGITTQGGTFLPWHTLSIKPNEQCDDGPLNGTPGHCKSDCTGIGTGTGNNNPTCTLTPSSVSIELGQSLTLNASYTSGVSATFTPSTTGMDNFTYPNRAGTATISPTTTTTYTLTVQGTGGTTPAVCSTTIHVTEPEPHLMCTLNFTQNPMMIGSTGFITREITGGIFDTTQIIVQPTIPGAFPHLVNFYQPNGSVIISPPNTGTYIFSMTVNNNTEYYTCTGALNVVPNVPPTCSLTTSTPNISLGQTAILNGSYTYASLTTLTPMITGLNFLYPTRSNNNIVVTPTETTTYTMNVLGINGSGTTCSTTVHVQNTGLSLSKQVLANVLYHSGDLVTFKIHFANNSSSTIHNVVISDYLPLSLEYVSSQIVGVAPYTFGTGTGGGSIYVEYSGFSLAAGQSGYVFVTGRFKGYQYSNQTLNNAFAKGDDTPLVYASALFSAYSPSGSASVTKTANSSSYYPGSDAQFTIAVTNNGPDTISNIIVTDNRPDGGCITLDANYTSTNGYFSALTATDPYQWIYTGTLAAGQTISLHLTGHISNATNCLGTYTNNASISYTINGNTQTGTAPGVNFTVSTTPSSTIIFEKRLISYGTNAGDPVVFELLYQNNGTATITNYDVVDYRPGTLNFVSASPMPTTQTVTSGGAELHWIFSTPLAPNGSGKITINGTIK